MVSTPGDNKAQNGRQACQQARHKQHSCFFHLALHQLTFEDDIIFRYK